jgi:M6 family metalloprotease-like protein
MRELRSGMVGRTPEAPAPARALGPRETPLVGTFRLPLLLGLFSDGPSEAPYTREEIQAEFFDGPSSYAGTLSDFYSELSGDLLQLIGSTSDWRQSGWSRASVTLGQSGLVSSFSQGVGAFVEALVQDLDDAGFDWAPFDQSGDGYVDVLAVFHGDHGAECDGATNRIWSHRWSLSAATQGRLPNGFRTSTPRPDGTDNLYVDDYIIQPLLACDAENISEIGTFAHELGHGFGLPDLYRTSSGGFFSGAGNWDLMGTGGWGCGGSTPERPCHMGAWSKLALGWVSVEDVGPGIDELVTLDPVETGGRVLRVPAQNGSNEYILLENRQRLGADGTLPEPGLLVWHIDQDILGLRWPSNTVNAEASAMGVWLRQADGRNDLTSTGGGRGDAGDPFPGCIKPSPADYSDPSVPCTVNREFHAGKPPTAISHQGDGLGITITEIELVGAQPQDVRFRLNTGVWTLVLEALQEGSPIDLPGFEVDGIAYSGSPVILPSVPFQTHEINAPTGLSLGPDVRAPFEAWSDGAPRAREVTNQFADIALTALYGGEELRLVVRTNDPAEGISPGGFVAEPGGLQPEGESFWFPPGTFVSVLATPRTGFAFREWTEPVSTSENPLGLLLEEPGELQADFDLVYGFSSLPEMSEIEATFPQEIQLAVTSGNEPIAWSIEVGVLPDGLSLGASTGTITGAATRLGDFPMELLARDAIGLEARGPLLVRVTRPELATEDLISTFVDSMDSLTDPQREFLDQEGNLDGQYDIGDLRAYLLSADE